MGIGPKGVFFTQYDTRNGVKARIEMKAAERMGASRNQAAVV